MADSSSHPNSPGSGGTTIDTDVLFQTNSEWITLSKSLDTLRAQLDRAKQDVETLQALKQAALEDPEHFLGLLQKNQVKFPALQHIARCPDIDLTKYSRRTSRRGSSKYEQNLEYLLAKVQELHRRGSLVPPVMLSTMIPVGPGASSPATAITAPIRERFVEIAGYQVVGPASGASIMRPSTAPPPSFYSGSDTPASLSGRVSPVEGNDGTAPSQPAPTSHPKPQRVQRVDLDNQYHATHYNMPWSEEEKKRLEELLLLYPEEGVQSRRYAKIAEALGTRTASQVCNRINKLNAKRLRHAKREAELARQQANKLLKELKKKDGSGEAMEEDDPLADLELDVEVDDQMKESEEYQEYLRLRQQLLEVKAQSLEHPGYRCDGCGMEPIIGARYHCALCEAPEIDLCASCRAADMTIAAHLPDHQMVLITDVPQQEADGDVVMN